MLKDELTKIIRGATLIHDDSRNLQDTIISPATDVCVHVTDTQAKSPLTVPSAAHYDEPGSA